MTFMLDKKSKKEPSFEVAMQRLEAIVHTLEAGDIPLERLVKTYEEGLAYQKICQEHLERADLLLNRKDVFENYTQENFLSSFSKFFTIEETFPIKGSLRTLYLMKVLP